jgi:hypothetical protein
MDALFFLIRFMGVVEFKIVFVRGEILGERIIIRGVGFYIGGILFVRRGFCWYGVVMCRFANGIFLVVRVIFLGVRFVFFRFR